MLNCRFINIIIALVLTFSAWLDASTGSICSDCLAGTYVITSGSTPTDAIMSQYIFNKDGTVYFNRSTSLTSLISIGTYIPYVGTWKKKGEFIYLTVVSTSAVSDGGDLSVALYTRNTQKLKIIDKNTLLRVQFVTKFIPLNEDPITAEGTIAFSSDEKFIAKRVRVIFEDL